MRFSFSAVNETADENEIPFSTEKRKRRSLSISHNFSHGLVANITFSTQRK